MGAAIKPSSQDNNNSVPPLLWLDSSVNESEDNLIGQKLLRSSIDHLKSFHDVNKCEEYIRSLSPDERIIFIVSGRLGREIIPRIHNFRQISSIYVYCWNKSINEQWAKPYKKILGIVTKFQELIEKIRFERSKRCQHEVNESLSISIYEPNNSSEYFVYSQLLINFLLRSKPTITDKIKLYEFCQEKYQNMDYELKLIEEFKDNYSSNRALEWYMKDSFLYRVFHRALRYQNFDLLFRFRFFIQDIRNALKKHPISSSIQVYRSQLMTQDEIRLLIHSLNSFISINTFLSTSIHRQLALVFLQQANVSLDLERVLFEIHADPSIKTSKSFGFIQSDNNIRQTEEVVFTLGSIFRLNNIQQQSDGLWIVQLSLCGDQDDQLKEILKSYEKYDEISFGNFLQKIGKINEAEKFFARLLSESTGNLPIISECYYALGCIAMEKKIDDLSLDWHQKSLEIKLHILKDDDISLANSYNKLGQIYMKKGEYQQAMPVFLRALKITLQVYGENHEKVAECYTNLGGAYQKQQNYIQALECYQQTLKICMQNSTIDQTDLGIAHNNLAIIYSCRNQYDLAFDHYENALKILQAILPSTHPELAVSYCGLGLVYEKRNQLEIALNCYQKTAVIYRQTFSSTHPDVAQIEQHIQCILSKLDK